MSKGPLHIFNEDSLDMTGRERPGKEKAEELVARIHEAGRLVLADISTYEEGMTAADIGADAISTTLSGYTPYSPQLSGMNIMPIIFHEIGHSLGINAATHTISQMIGEKEGFRPYLSKYYNYTLYCNNNGLLIGRG